MPEPGWGIIELEFDAPRRSPLWLASGLWHQHDGSSQIFGALHNLPPSPNATLEARIEILHLETYASLFQCYRVVGGELFPSQPPCPEYRQSRLSFAPLPSWTQLSTKLHIRIEQDEIPDFCT